LGTKEAILESAMVLFNEYGTGRVSTNHIAEEAGVSPGNLYYHFKNKEEIIRNLFDVMVADWSGVYESVDGKVFTLAFGEEFLIGHYEMLWKYRFFSREMVALIQKDPLLGEKQFATYAQRMNQLEAILLSAEEDGFIDFRSDKALIENVLTIIMVISNQFLIHLESVGADVTKKELGKGAALVLQVLRPYFVNEDGFIS
jgi:AcrR family transcriptional regulator